jgi:hypothetical protein
MKKQDKKILFNINDDLKKKFVMKCDENNMKMSTRIKYLIQLDIDNKILIKH